MEEEINPEDYEEKFKHIAAGFVADELPPKMIKPFLDHVKADPFGVNVKKEPGPQPLPIVEKENAKKDVNTDSKTNTFK